MIARMQLLHSLGGLKQRLRGSGVQAQGPEGGKGSLSCQALSCGGLWSGRVQSAACWALTAARAGVGSEGTSAGQGSTVCYMPEVPLLASCDVSLCRTAARTGSTIESVELLYKRSPQ